MIYKHWSHVKNWRWQDFKPQELASRGDGSLFVNEEALDALQTARILAGKPFYINSAYRDPIYNARIGGAPLSRHKFGDAFDISLRNHDKQTLIRICKEAGFKGLGVNYSSFLHVDTWRARQW